MLCPAFRFVRRIFKEYSLTFALVFAHRYLLLLAVLSLVFNWVEEAKSSVSGGNGMMIPFAAINALMVR